MALGRASAGWTEGWPMATRQTGCVLGISKVQQLTKWQIRGMSVEGDSGGEWRFRRVTTDGREGWANTPVLAGR